MLKRPQAPVPPTSLLVLLAVVAAPGCFTLSDVDSIRSERPGVVAPGASHTCARTEAGLYCWGDNLSGQLGGTPAEASWPYVHLDLGAVDGLASGTAHSCALLESGRVTCWGSNEFGQLGTAPSLTTEPPTLIAGITDAVQITAGGQHTCVRLDSGTAMCWGANDSGQLGSASAEAPTAPVTVSGLVGATAIAAGGGHTCALLETRSVVCWGANRFGELGDGSATNRTTPGAVSGVAEVRVVAAGGSHTCAVVADGAVRCWGANHRRQLGGETLGAEGSYTPVDVLGLPPAVSLALGEGHSCARLEDDTVRCWGRSDGGQLGGGTTSYPPDVFPLPTAVAGLVAVAELASHADHTCAITRSGQLYCWGRNDAGQLGAADLIHRSAPLAVNPSRQAPPSPLPEPVGDVGDVAD